MRLTILGEDWESGDDDGRPPIFLPKKYKRGESPYTDMVGYKIENPQYKQTQEILAKKDNPFTTYGSYASSAHRFYNGLWVAYYERIGDPIDNSFLTREVESEAEAKRYESETKLFERRKFFFEQVMDSDDEVEELRANLEGDLRHVKFQKIRAKLENLLTEVKREQQRRGPKRRGPTPLR